MLASTYEYHKYGFHQIEINWMGIFRPTVSFQLQHRKRQTVSLFCILASTYEFLNYGLHQIEINWMDIFHPTVSFQLQHRKRQTISLSCMLASASKAAANGY